LNFGGLKPLVTTLIISSNQKPATSSRVVKMLTVSEIEFLRQDMKCANDILEKLLHSTSR